MIVTSLPVHAARVPTEEAGKSGLAKDQVKIKEKYGGGYPANVEGLHHLHCLNLLRKSLVWNFEYYKNQSMGPFSNDANILKHHVSKLFSFTTSSSQADQRVQPIAWISYASNSCAPLMSVYWGKSGTNLLDRAWKHSSTSTRYTNAETSMPFETGRKSTSCPQHKILPKTFWSHRKMVTEYGTKYLELSSKCGGACATSSWIHRRWKGGLARPSQSPCRSSPSTFLWT